MTKDISRLNSWHKSAPLFTPNNQDVEDILQVLEKYIDLSRPMITLVVRDSGYDLHYGEVMDDIDIVNRNAYRNTPITSFIPVIRFFTSLGYTVVRVGRHSNVSLDSSEPHFFDYSIMREVHSDKADVIIPFLSKFGLTTGSGIDEFLNFFRKPIYRFNVSPPGTIPYSQLSQHNLIPDYIDMNTGEKFPIEYVLSEPISSTPPYKLYESKSIRIQPKSADALLAFARLVHRETNSATNNTILGNFQKIGPYYY